MTQNEAYGELAHAIVVQAAKDWRTLCQYLLEPKRDTEIVKQKVTFDSLRRFFKSPWCDTLCVGVNPQMILDRLEKELKETETKKQIIGGQ